MIGKLNEIEEKAVKEFSKEIKAFSGNNIKQILLFGSKARGDFKKDSDIDIFILTGRSDPIQRKKITSLTSKILLQYGVLVSPKIIEESHFAFIKELGTAFAKNILKEGINI